MKTSALLVGAILCAGLAVVNGQEFLTNGLIAYYPFNGNANDETGNGYDGSVYGATLTTDRYGLTDSVYSFDGTNDYIHVPYLVTSANPFTWSVWFRPGYSGTNLAMQILNQGLAPTRISPSFYLNGHVPGAIVFYNYTFTGYFVFSETRSSWNTDTWFHAVITSDAGGNRKLYVNGVEEGASTGIPFGEQNPNLYIGANIAHGGSAWFDGLIDDIRIYNRALSEVEVMDLNRLESIPELRIATSHVRLCWAAAAGRTFQVQYKSEATTNMWTALGSPIVGTGTNLCITDEVSGSQKFYRLEIVE